MTKKQYQRYSPEFKIHAKSRMVTLGFIIVSVTISIGVLKYDHARSLGPQLASWMDRSNDSQSERVSNHHLGKYQRCLGNMIERYCNPNSLYYT